MRKDEAQKLYVITWTLLLEYKNLLCHPHCPSLAGGRRGGGAWILIAEERQTSDRTL